MRGRRGTGILKLFKSLQRIPTLDISRLVEPREGQRPPGVPQPGKLLARLRPKKRNGLLLSQPTTRVSLDATWRSPCLVRCPCLVTDSSLIVHTSGSKHENRTSPSRCLHHGHRCQVFMNKNQETGRALAVMHPSGGSAVAVACVTRDDTG